MIPMPDLLPPHLHIMLIITKKLVKHNQELVGK